jgi:hypothetical protein
VFLTFIKGKANPFYQSKEHVKVTEGKIF